MTLRGAGDTKQKQSSSVTPGRVRISGRIIAPPLSRRCREERLIADGSDGAVIKRMKKAAKDAGAAVKIIAPKVGGAELADGSMLAADTQLAGAPSVLFDAVAVILSSEGAKTLSMESAAIDFVRDAFGHLTAIAVDEGGRALLKKADVAKDAGVVDANDRNAFIAAAQTRQWDREQSVRTLA